MKMGGEEVIAAPSETVWRASYDPAVLKQCILGCESITKSSDTQMKARVVVKWARSKQASRATWN